MSILKGKKIDPLARAKGRLIFTGFVFMLVFLAIGFRLADLTLLNDKKDARLELLNKDGDKDTAFNGFRPPVYDQAGELVATSVETKSLYADAYLVRDPQKTAAELKKLFPEINEEHIRKRLDSNNRFVWIKRHLSPDEQYAVNKLGIPGLNFQEEYRRLYPYGNAMAHILGYTDIDNRGIAGLERGLDDVFTNTTKKNVRPEKVTLTLDARIQHIVKDELAKAIEKFSAKAGSGVVMNAKTGEILALTSLPDYDPHHPNKASAEEKFNRTTLGVYEMGSTFKLFSAAAALEEGNVKLSSTFDCRKPLTYGRFTIHDYHPEKKIMAVPEIFIHSSNIGHAQMAEKVGNDKTKAFFNKLGFYDRVPVEIPELGKPLTPDPWRDIHTVTTSYGHGIAVSPLHLVSAAATVLNGGFRVHPTLVKKDTVSVPSERVISARTSQYLRELMRATVAVGTGKNAEAKGFLVGGKTGTSEKAKAGTYDKKLLMSSFLGAYPINDPEYIVYLMVDEPVGNQSSYGYATGGWVAAPAVKNIILRMSSLLGVRPVSLEEEQKFDKSMAVTAILPREFNLGRDYVAAQ